MTDKKVGRDFFCGCAAGERLSGNLIVFICCKSVTVYYSLCICNDHLDLFASFWSSNNLKLKHYNPNGCPLWTPSNLYSQKSCTLRFDHINSCTNLSRNLNHKQTTRRVIWCRHQLFIQLINFSCGTGVTLSDSHISYVGFGSGFDLFVTKMENFFNVDNFMPAEAHILN